MQITPLLTPEQVANLLQVHHLTVLKLIQKGDLNAVKLGRVYRITEAGFTQFLAANQTVKPKSKTKVRPSNLTRRHVV